MVKDFNEMIKVDITKYTEEKPNFVWDKVNKKSVQKGSFNYLNWAKCLILLYANGAENVTYTALASDNGTTMFYDSKYFCPEVRVNVVIDGKEGTFSYPVVRGTRVITVDKINQLEVHVATQRAFVKGVAILTGLGLTLWSKYDIDEKDLLEQAEQYSIEHLRKSVQQSYLDVSKALGGANKLNKALDLTVGELSKMFASKVQQDLDDLQSKITIASASGGSQ